ncbi:MAG: hypothetical protein P8Y97_21095 [Candidatus Lokiarchaeota archaeon]
MISIKKEEFLESEFRIHTKIYPNGQLAVYLKDEFGLPLAELSIRSNSIDLAENEFILKDYSENQLYIDILLQKGLIAHTDRFLFVGTHLCPICRIKN